MMFSDDDSSSESLSITEILQETKSDISKSMREPKKVIESDSESDVDDSIIVSDSDHDDATDVIESPEDDHNESLIQKVKMKKGGRVLESDSESDEHNATEHDEEAGVDADSSGMKFGAVPKIRDSEDFSKRKSVFSSTKLQFEEVETDPENVSVVDISSDPEAPEEQEINLPKQVKGELRQNTLNDFVNKGLPENVAKKTFVSEAQFNVQQSKVKNLEMELAKVEAMLKTINLSALPDKGAKLKKRYTDMVDQVAIENGKLVSLAVDRKAAPVPEEKRVPNWEVLSAAADAIQPRTFGKQAVATINTQKEMTLERLHQLHGSLKTCPDENTLAENPRGLKVELMPHQKRALAWILWREQQKPSGGILADDMGLGKTLTMISVLLKCRENVKSDDDDSNDENEPDHRSGKYRGGTLVVCPASLLSQWEAEVKKCVRRGLIDVELYHGPKRETKPRRLAKHDMVVTTYAIVMNENEKQGTVFRVKWDRVILDEAHQIRNHKSLTSIAVCQLSARYRWALTGTPVHNKEEDLFSLLKFLRCSPFDNLAVWKRWVASKSAGGQERLNTVISSLLLRRTKAELQTEGALLCLPDRQWALIRVTLDGKEMDVYHKIMIFSRNLFAQFMHQRAQKQEAGYYGTYTGQGSQEFYKMHQKLVKLNKTKEVKQHEILVLLLRLRQICNHPSLITGMLDDDQDLKDDDSGDEQELNILDQLNRLNLEDEDQNAEASIGGVADQPEGVKLAEATRGLLNPSNPIFAEDRRSSKIRVVLQILKEKVLDTENDKAIVVSQWTGMLRLLAIQLKNERIKYEELNGTIPVHKRMGIVENINNPRHETRVLLLSLTAGGIGLNLVGANHLFLLDLHWNPQLEMQAQDRIYRVGQGKPVFVYKFMTVETVEERIKTLQEKKLSIAESLLTGTKIQSKLTLDDLKMIFNFNP